MIDDDELLITKDKCENIHHWNK